MMRVRRIDWLLILGYVISPMDSLRFVGKVGLSELSLLLWALHRFRSSAESRINAIEAFWVPFMACIFIGRYIGSIVAPNEMYPLSGMMVYVFFAVFSIGSARKLETYSKDYLLHIALLSCTLSAYHYLFLYILVGVFGIDVPVITEWFFDKFTGGAENPSKLSVFLSCNTFMLIYSWLKARDSSFFKRVVLALGIASCYYVGTKTQSSMFYVTIMGSIVVFLIMQAYEKVSDRRAKTLISLTIVFVLALACLFWREIYDIAYEWVLRDSNGLERFELFKSIKYSLEKSWLFGLGPGSHAKNGAWQYHNSYLEILAMSGATGLLLFVGLTINLMTRSQRDIDTLLLVVPYLIYSLGSYAVRSMGFWIAVVYLYSLTDCDDTSGCIRGEVRQQGIDVSANPRKACA